MGWSVRVLLRRAATQHTILSAVLAVAIVGASLLGTFALLLTSSEQRALDVTLARSPASAVEIETTLSIGTNPPAPALDAARTALASVAGDVPTERTEWLTSPAYRLPQAATPGEQLGYLESVPSVSDRAELTAGAWPQTATDASGRIQIAIPTVAASTFGWMLGTEIPLVSTSSLATTTAIVTGVFDAGHDRTAWSRDLLRGDLSDPSFPVPGSFGFILEPMFGPFVAAPDAFATGAAETESAHVVLRPFLDQVSPSALADLRARLTTAPRDAVVAVDPHVTSTVFSSQLAATIDSARGRLAVTRVGLVVVGLMLTVLAVTVLLLAARLLAERRAGEQTLMTARGSSGRQLLGLAGLEALLIAALTTTVAPWLARALYRAITAQDVFRRAGLDVDPRLPATLWVTCAGASLVFAAVLLGPLLRRRTSVVDTEQQQVRQSRRGALTRSGIDVALVALAGVAYWQLRQYRSPVLASGGIDPILVAGPALLLLAGATLALRVVPIAASVAERLAARSRRLVLPLAAWEVGRRPGRASGAVLMLTLAVAVGVFSQSFLVTWRASQVDQADLQVGTDVRIGRMSSPPLAQSAAVAALPGAGAVSAVTTRSATLGKAPEPGYQTVSTRGVGLVALDTTQAAALLRGSAPGGGRWADLLAGLRPADTVTGAALAGAPDSLRLDVTATAVPASTTLRLLESVIVQDSHGLRIALPVPAVPLDATLHDVEVPIPHTDGAPLAAPLSVVGLTTQVVTLPDAHSTPTNRNSMTRTELTVRTENLRAVTGGVETATLLAPTPWQVHALPGDFRSTPDVSARSSDDGSSLTTRGAFRSWSVDAGNAGFTATTFASPDAVPVVVTDALLDQLAIHVGDRVAINVGGPSVTADIVASVPYLPALQADVGLAVDRDLLSRALIASGWTDPLLDEWWVQVPAADAGALDAAVATGLFTTTTDRYALAVDRRDGPLRIGVQGALWIATAACLLLALAGFAMSATVSVRLRRLEFARLQALGATRHRLVRAVLGEHALLGGLGLAAGLAVGALLGQLVVPLLTVSADGAAPVPNVDVHWPWGVEANLLATMTALIAATVTVTALALLRPASSTLLRIGEDR